MIGISGVEGALRVLRGNTLGIKAGCALSKRASSGPTRLDPATSSPCEAWFGSEFRGQVARGRGTAEYRTEEYRMSKGEAARRRGYYSKWDGGGGLGIKRMNEKRFLIDEIHLLWSCRFWV